MVDRIEKALRRLSDKERQAIRGIIRRLKAGTITGLDIKKLKGNATVYRIRKGSMRIMYTVETNKNIKILAIERRSDTTYK